MGCFHGEQSQVCEVCIWPSPVIVLASPHSGALFLLAQKRPQSPSNKLIEWLECGSSGMFEIPKPASDRRAQSPRAAGLPAYLATPSQHSAPSHVACPGIALHATNQRTGRVSDFALDEQARRHTPPNRVRHPADCQFASSCSPPRLTATQLPSATGSWLTLARTLTVLVSRLNGRTHPRPDRGSMDTWIPAFAGMTGSGRPSCWPAC